MVLLVFVGITNTVLYAVMESPSTRGMIFTIAYLLFRDGEQSSGQMASDDGLHATKIGAVWVLDRRGATRLLEVLHLQHFEVGHAFNIIRESFHAEVWQHDFRE